MPEPADGPAQESTDARWAEASARRYLSREVKWMRMRIVRVIYASAALATLLLAAGAKWKAN